MHRNAVDERFPGVVRPDALRQDLDDNQVLYGRKLENREIVTTSVRTPKAAVKLLDLLNKYSAHERGTHTTGASQ